MRSKIDPTELRTIEDLLQDFSSNPELTPYKVYKISWSRFNVLQQVPFSEIFKSFKVRLFFRLVFFKLIEVFHKFIFEDLFTFAGEFRSKDDPNAGRVYFGNQHAQRRKPQFEGTPPDDIYWELLKAVWFLKKSSKDPLYHAMRFYQRFVQIHPFYDANGRIGRLITTIYLSYHNLVLSWSEFDSKSKFIKKLNRCHLNPSEETFGYLVDYLRPFTSSLNEFEELKSNK